MEQETTKDFFDLTESGNFAGPYFDKETGLPSEVFA